MAQAYANGKIYKIVNKNDPEEFYVGSTKNHLHVRWQGHKNKMKEIPDYLLYQRMHELGFDCFHMVLIEDHPCDNIYQLRQRENYWICELKPKLNKIRAYLTDEERAEMKIKCEKCNSIVRQSNIARHKRSKKCQSYQSQYTEIEFID